VFVHFEQRFSTQAATLLARLQETDEKDNTSPAYMMLSNALVVAAAHQNNVANSNGQKQVATLQTTAIKVSPPESGHKNGNISESKLSPMPSSPSTHQTSDLAPLGFSESAAIQHSTANIAEENESIAPIVAHSSRLSARLPARISARLVPPNPVPEDTEGESGVVQKGAPHHIFAANLDWDCPEYIVHRDLHDIGQAYIIRKELGSGGFAVVYQATERATGKEFALKMMLKNAIQKYMSYIESEVIVMATFNHPRLISLHEVVRTPQHLVLVMELVRGGELFDHIIQNKNISEAATKDIFHQLLEAIEELHNNGVVHRDLKPENILVEGVGIDRCEIKLADFGLAVFHEPGKLVTQGAGTPEYSAPEVVSGQPHDFPCDMWSLGVILYVMLSGVPPFYGNSDQEIITRVKQGTYIFPKRQFAKVSEGAKDLIRNLLVVDPSTRFTISQVKEHPWLWNSRREDDETLDGVSEHLKYLAATKKFRQAVMAVVALNRVSNMHAILAAQIHVMDHSSRTRQASIDTRRMLMSPLAQPYLSTHTHTAASMQSSHSGFSSSPSPQMQNRSTPVSPMIKPALKNSQPLKLNSSTKTQADSTAVAGPSVGKSPGPKFVAARSQLASVSLPGNEAPMFPARIAAGGKSVAKNPPKITVPHNNGGNNVDNYMESPVFPKHAAGGGGGGGGGRAIANTRKSSITHGPKLDASKRAYSAPPGRRTSIERLSQPTNAPSPILTRPRSVGAGPVRNRAAASRHAKGRDPRFR
jgi:calcium/calmodulin-dependent protein kinase I